jgi:uncharacterized membrane protein
MTKLLSFPRYLLRLYSLKSELEQLMTTSVFFCTLILAIRIIYTGAITFVFLEWNLFLAFVPYLISHWLMNKPAVLEKKWKFAVGFFIWLVFIPNAFYILTDLFHLQENNDTPRWFDLLLILSFAWNGLLAGILSVRQMEKMVQVLYGNRHEFIFLYPVMLLNALGIYIGRYLRYNSWDIITNPFHLMMDMFNLVAHPVLYKYGWAMILFYSVFIMILYMTIKRISKFVG